MKNSVIHSLMVRLLRRTGAFVPLRRTFDWLFYRNTKTNIEVSSIVATFHSPTKKMVAGLQDLTERVIIEEFIHRLRIGDVVWDVGANIGVYSILASNVVGAEGLVIGFEPEKNTRAMLLRNIQVNRRENVLVSEVALGSRNETGLLYTSVTSNVGSHSMAQRKGEVSSQGVVIKVRTAHSLIDSKELSSPDALKIDVEGAEVGVLKGFKDSLMGQKLRLVLIEVHPNMIPLYGENENAMLTLLRENGYKETLRLQRGDQYHLIFEKNLTV